VPVPADVLGTAIAGAATAADTAIAATSGRPILLMRVRGIYPP
jgi:hypothetical protein